MENSTQANYTRVVFAVNGYAELCRELGATPVYLDEEETRTFRFDAGVVAPASTRGAYDAETFELPRTVAERLIERRDENLYVNLPKLKTHSMTGVTLGIKNQWGFLTHASRGRDHNHNLHTKLADVLAFICPDVTLVDGVEGTIHGHYPATALADRCVKPFRVLLGSANVVAADIAGAAILGLKPLDVPHLAEAIARGFGDGVKSADDISCVGDIDSLEGVDLLGDRPQGGYPTDLCDAFPADVPLVTGNQLACKEGCINNPRTVLQVLACDHRGEGGFTIVAGKGFDASDIDAIKGRILIAGRCAIEEVGERLIARLGRRNVHLSGECNDLRATVEALCHLMRVSPLALVEKRRVAATIAYAEARLRGSTSRVPSLFARVFKRT